MSEEPENFDSIIAAALRKQAANRAAAETQQAAKRREAERIANLSRECLENVIQPIVEEARIALQLAGVSVQRGNGQDSRTNAPLCSLHIDPDSNKRFHITFRAEVAGIHIAYCIPGILESGQTSQGILSKGEIHNHINNFINATIPKL